MKTSVITNFFRKTSVRVSLAVFAILWSLFAVLFYASYKAASAHLQANKPNEMQNRSELEVFYAPLSLRVGEEFSLPDLTDYFNESGYDFSENETPGSYSIKQNSVKFAARSNAFASGEILFEKNRVKKILVGGQKIEKIEIEPLPMRVYQIY